MMDSERVVVEIEGRRVRESGRRDRGKEGERESGSRDREKEGEREW